MVVVVLVVVVVVLAVMVLVPCARFLLKPSLGRMPKQLDWIVNKDPVHDLREKNTWSHGMNSCKWIYKVVLMNEGEVSEIIAMHSKRESAMRTFSNCCEKQRLCCRPLRFCIIAERCNN